MDTLKLKAFISTSRKDAVHDLREKGQRYLIADCQVAAGKIITKDAHQSNKWVIFEKGEGRCKITIGDCSEIIELHPKEAQVFFVPAGTKHSFRAIAALDCTVLIGGFN